MSPEEGIGRTAVLDNEVMDKWMKHRDRGGVCVHTHPTSIQRKYQSQQETGPTSQEDTSLSTGQSLPYPLHTGSQDFCCLMETIIGLSQHSPPLFMTNVQDQTSCTKAGRQQGLWRPSRNHRTHF